MPDEVVRVGPGVHLAVLAHRGQQRLDQRQVTPGARRLRRHQVGAPAQVAMLDVGSAELRADVVASFRNTKFSDEALVRLLGLTKSDPDPKVRGECWETFGDIADEPEIRSAMLAVLTDPAAALVARRGPAGSLGDSQCRGLEST